MLTVTARSATAFLMGSLFLLGAGSVAQAATFCVTSGTDLNAALDTAGGNQQDDVIKIAVGTHATITLTGFTQWEYAPSDRDHNLTISGGWNPASNCAVQSTRDPRQTVLDARHRGPAFGVVMLAGGGSGFTADVEISNLTVTRGSNSIFPNTNAASGIELNFSGAVGAAVTVDNVLVTGGLSTAGGASTRIANFYMEGGGFLKIRNSQFLNNNLTGAFASGVRVQASSGAIGFFTNNSISGNAVNFSQSKGLNADGVVTLSNNVSADNTSTRSSSWDFYSEEPTSLTLRNNHFETRSTINGSPQSETGGTTGDPGWSMVGSLMVPNSVSPLRDSGLNSPTGGVPNIDFVGAARVINGTIDRGALEAAQLTLVGPAITAVDPVNNSTTSISGTVGETVQVVLGFSSSGAVGSGSTQLTCVAGNGPITITSNAVQTASAGAPVAPVFANVVVGPTPQTATLSCTAVRDNAANQTFFFTFQVGGSAIFASSFE